MQQETRGRPSRITEKQKIEMWRLYKKSGLGYISIGHKLRIDSETVRYHINKIKRKEQEKYDLLLHSSAKSAP
jgi:DNA-binding CsgD family transcriptional regulator